MHPQSQCTDSSCKTCRSHSPLLPCSISLLMQIPAWTTFGPADHRVMCKSLLLQLTVKVPQPLFIKKWALAVHIWNNPPAPLESSSVRSTQPCLCWPCQNSLQAGSCIIFFEFHLSKKHCSNLHLCKEPNYISGHPENLFSKFGIQTFSNLRINCSAVQSFYFRVCGFGALLLSLNWILNCYSV